MVQSTTNVTCTGHDAEKHKDGLSAPEVVLGTFFFFHLCDAAVIDHASTPKNEVKV